MTNQTIEPINPFHSNDKKVEQIAHRIISPYKVTLKDSAQINLKDSLLREIASFSFNFLAIVLTTPALLNVIRGNVRILFLLKNNPDLLREVLKNPQKLYDLKFSSSTEIKKALNPLKYEKKENSSNVKNSGAEKSYKKRYLSETLNRNESVVKQPPVSKSSQNVNLKPHKLEAEVIAKAHVENPNINSGVGNFKSISRVDTKGTSHLPHDLELQPELVTTARAFVFDPRLQALLAPLTVISNKTKRLSNNSGDDDDFEVENSEERAESLKDLDIEKITEVTETQATSKINVNLK